ncbi:MAG: hypothetical protein JSV05_06180 [Candidatus Bathyarchaeota archaeon]|nr:MAG: hypothetical protein JSV05_06180 [Candidatus Bathyarchaeota archaeon]
MDLTFLASLTPGILILGGGAAASWLLEKLKPSFDEENGDGSFSKIVSFFGFFIGGLMLITEAGVWATSGWDAGTQILLILTGLALMLKPLKDIPWAAFVALLVGGLCVGLLFLVFPLPETVLGVSSTWVYILVFLAPALFAYVLFKFLEDVLKLLALILTFTPLKTILGLLCIIQGILLLQDISLFSIVLSSCL